MSRIIVLDINDLLWHTLCFGLFQLPGDTTIGGMRSEEDFLKKLLEPQVCGFVFFHDNSVDAQSFVIENPGLRVVFVHKRDTKLGVSGNNILLVSREEVEEQPVLAAARVRLFLYPDSA